MIYLSRDQCRELDRRAIESLGIPGNVLMENAGRGMAELMRTLGASGPVVVCCGRGNNGGDGMVIGRHLANGGCPVRVLVFAEPVRLPADAATNYHIVERMAADARTGLVLETHPDGLGNPDLSAVLAGADWVVDALFGTGLRGQVPAPLDRVITAINASAARVLAVDIPSGLDCDSGRPLGVAVRAHHTATVAAPKRGFVEPGAAAYVGSQHIIDMGCPPTLIEAVGTAMGAGPA
jgi:NAD(P)H-hydrate epimerase